MRRIVFTGGGTGGHIIPNIALIKKLKEKYPNIEILYIGSKKGPEGKMIQEIGIPFQSIPTGKLRRYFSFENIVDFFRLPFGILRAYNLLGKFKPEVIFSKGGYVSIPVIYAARFRKIPIVLHESDVSPGLANKIAAKKANVLCLAHFESQQYFPRETKKVVTGNPVREEIFKGDPERAYRMTGYSKDIPTILIMGGSQGAKHINEEISLAANELANHYQIIHICGHGKIPSAIPISEKVRLRYQAYEYVNEQLPDFYSIADLVISRAGANSLAEIEALKLLAILIPIGKEASRGEQTINALVFQERNPKTKVIEDEILTYKNLVFNVKQILPPESFVKKDNSVPTSDKATEKIIEVLDGFLGEVCEKKDNEEEQVEKSN